MVEMMAWLGIARGEEDDSWQGMIMKEAMTWSNTSGEERCGQAHRVRCGEVNWRETRCWRRSCRLCCGGGKLAGRESSQDCIAPVKEAQARLCASECLKCCG